MQRLIEGDDKYLDQRTKYVASLGWWHDFLCKTIVLVSGNPLEKSRYSNLRPHIQALTVPLTGLSNA